MEDETPKPPVQVGIWFWIAIVPSFEKKKSIKVMVETAAPQPITSKPTVVEPQTSAIVNDPPPPPTVATASAAPSRNPLSQPFATSSSSNNKPDSRPSSRQRRMPPPSASR